MKSEDAFPRRLILCRMLTGFIIIGIIGCGVKAPPRAPQARPLATAADFKAEAHPKNFVLTWQIPASSAGDERLAGFRILRYRTALTDEACRDCTGGFQDAGTVMVETEHRESRPMRFVDAPKPGFRYFYKVAAFGTGGETGEDSRVITVSYPQ